MNKISAGEYRVGPNERCVTCRGPTEFEMRQFRNPAKLKTQFGQWVSERPRGTRAFKFFLLMKGTELDFFSF